MSRLLGIATACVAVLGLIPLEGRQGQRDAERQKALVQSLLQGRAADERSLHEIQLKDRMRKIESGEPLSSHMEFDIQREVEGRLKPVPFENGGLAPKLPQDQFGYYRALTPSEKKTLVEKAASVARIELEVGTDVVARGTGFRVGADLLATNCHVLASIARLETNGTWRLRSDKVRAHFADGPAHDMAREFRVTDVVAVPNRRGLDIAVVRLAQTSLESNGSLPGGLTLRTTQLVQDWPVESGLPVAVVGFPVVASSRESNYQQLSALGQFAKVYSPGAVLELKAQDNVDFLHHLAGTTAGSSGSPVFAIPSFEVIGVHNCCTAAGTPPPVTLPCAVAASAPAGRNLAVSAPQVFADPQLSKVLRTP